MKLNLLIVEDVPRIVSSWEEKIAFYAVEDTPVYTLTPTFVTTLQDAQKAIEYTTFDAAVVDIRLDEGGDQTFHGNDVLAELASKSLTVCAVYTGEPGTEVVDDHQKDFVRVFQKGEGEIERILEWLDSKADMISAIQTMQDSFNKSMAKAFTRSIWPRWSYWLNGEQEQDFASQALTRHMATHLHASFLNDEEVGAHPEEYFFIPALQENLDTGDIIQTEGKLEIIVTPRCDMVRSKSNTPTYQLVSLLDRSEDWAKLEEKLKQRKAEGTPKQITSAQNEIRKFTNHNGESGGHFIQQFRMKVNGEDKTFGPFYAQFNVLRSIERTEENTQALLDNRVASLSNEFVPSLVERLGTYFSRIGTPDYSHPE
ncbi:hypothetical protein HL669_09780 [Vibrio parahaemolyticus]|uniref:hypothetical protein n=1 Tax=Vibrio parahaemolyticus TaxID=670 RepID=UPI0014850D82|nr:hypothetical protein [Vibrio parahaemolyticus]NNU11917.1 hypothetical protein [Vibrio parahaemolyticus]QQE17363.1 hypothetical protein JCT83_18785 [Vibrio parahaemolyticus]